MSRHFMSTKLASAALYLVLVVAGISGMVNAAPEPINPADLSTMATFDGNYEWEAEKFVANTKEDLLEKLDWARQNNVTTRVIGSGWSFNKFLDPAKADGTPGLNILLRGDFDGVEEYDEEKNTIKAGGGTMRGPIYTELYSRGRQLLAAGECFSLEESQTVGGILANAVHETFQIGFTPESVESVEVAVFDPETGKAVIKSLSDADGDEFYAQFGGMGMPGIITSATFKTEPVSYWHRMPYLPGVDYIDAFNPGQREPTMDELIQTYGIPAQTSDANGTLEVDYVDGAPIFYPDSWHYQSTYPNFLEDLVAKFNKTTNDDGTTELIAACFYMWTDVDDENAGQVMAKGEYDMPCRMYKRAKGPIPEHVVNYTAFDDTSFRMGKALNHMTPYPNTVRAKSNSSQAPYSDPFMAHHMDRALQAVEDSIHQAEWTAANLLNFPDDPDGAVTNMSWAYMTEIPNLTGPAYIRQGFEVAVEFYVEPKDTEAFAAIVRQAQKDMADAAEKDPDYAKNAPYGGRGSVPNSDTRFVIGSPTAFMSPYYGANRLVVDLGHYSGEWRNKDYDVLVTSILEAAKDQNIPIRQNTGKYFIYDPELIHYMYDEATRERFTKVLDKYDPDNVFAPKQWRDLFTVEQQQ